MRPHRIALALLVPFLLFLAGCSGATPTPQVIVVTATPEPTTPTAEAATAPATAPGENAVDAPAPAPVVTDGPKPSTEDGRIAFMGPYGQNLQVFVMNADGTGLTLVTGDDPGGTAFPSLSPDGSRVAFVSSRDGNPEIYVKDLETEEQIRLTDDPGIDNQPQFSPDGSKIAFVLLNRSGSLDIWIMDADGENQQALTTREGDELMGAWSPDGESLLIIDQAAQVQNIWKLAVAGGELTQLTANQGIDAGPTFSPDGSRIAFFSDRAGGRLNLFTMAADGSDVKQLTNGPDDSLFPVYSPDGEWIVYSVVRGQTPSVAAIAATGGTPVLLNGEVEGLPTSWQPVDEPLPETGFTQGPQQRNVKVSEEVLATAFSRGNPDAPVTIIEFSDYQCPFCKQFVDTTLLQIETYIENGQVRLVFVDFPLEIHPQAPAAARAARCSADQGQEEAYWKMHDALFARQSDWSGVQEPNEIFSSLATEIGLDGEQLLACLESGQFEDEVNAGLQEGMRLQVSGTPTFFINGTRLVGAQPFEAFQPLIEEQIK